MSNEKEPEAEASEERHPSSEARDKRADELKAAEEKEARIKAHKEWVEKNAQADAEILKVTWKDLGFDRHEVYNVPCWEDVVDAFAKSFPGHDYGQLYHDLTFYWIKQVKEHFVKHIWATVRPVDYLFLGAPGTQDIGFLSQTKKKNIRLADTLAIKRRSDEEDQKEDDEQERSDANDSAHEDLPQRDG